MNRRIYYFAALAVMMLFGIASNTAYAETIHMYVEKMPQHWQKQFDGLLEEAAKYWEKKIPGLKFETVKFVDQSDFVVQWTSQHGEGKIGYYSEDTSNTYGKPTMAVTLGYFADKKLNLVSYEHALLVTKHELGHALGMPHSDNPDDAMYPTVDDYESLQIQSSQSARISVNDWNAASEKYQKISGETIIPLALLLDDAKVHLNLASFESQSEYDAVWMHYWWAKKYLAEAERLQIEGGSHVLESNYEESYHAFKSSYENALKAKQKIEQVLSYTKER